MIFQTLIGGYSSLELVSWANGTPAQLAAMLDAHYAGRINIANYWSVGDSRTDTLGAIDANDCTDAMAAQTAQLVLMNMGGKTLVNAEHGVTTCAFVVGFKNCLTGEGKFNTVDTSIYSSSAVRQFLNNQLYIALPSDLRSIFKLFVNKTKNGSSGNIFETEDLLVLPAAIEVTGTTSYGAEGSQLTYYATTANRIKNDWYWVRTPRDASFCMGINTGGYLDTDQKYPSSTQGISPFGVI